MDVSTRSASSDRDARGAAFAHTTVHGDWGVGFPAGPRVSVHAIVAGRGAPVGRRSRRTRRGWRPATSSSCASHSATTWPTCPARRASPSTTSRSTPSGRRRTRRRATARPTDLLLRRLRLRGRPLPLRRSTRCRRPSACARRPAARRAPRWTSSAARCSTTRPASRRLLDRLLDVALVQVLREHSHRRWTPAPPPGLEPPATPTSAPRCAPCTPSPRAQWTVADLAAEATLSRSAFARRFTDQLGVGPLAYLTEWRIGPRPRAPARLRRPPRRGRPGARLRLGVRLRRGLQAPPRRRPGPLAHGQARSPPDPRGLPAADQHSLHADAVVEDVDRSTSVALDDSR